MTERSAVNARETAGPRGPARRWSRRTPVAVAACGVLAAGCVALLPGTAQAGTAPAAGPHAEQAEFAAAAARFHVPLPVLLGVAYAESRWDAHPGQYNTGGGFGPMNLTDVTAAMVDGGGAGAAGRASTAGLTADPALHTLTAAARLTGATAAQLRDDTGRNILGGAALLASYEKALTGGTSTDPGDWYGAVARYSGSPDRGAAASFADRVFTGIADGAHRTTAEGQDVPMAADASVRPATGQLALLGLKADDTTATDCPADLDCSFIAAASSNYQVANRPDDGMKIRYIVIHDTETSYQNAIDAFATAGNGDAANYVMRASDGAVTQMVPDKDLAFHAGNYWFNMHSVGIEHEGFAAHGATWYTQTQYQNTADLVTYLAARYGIPLDRQHIIGHDNVPGPLESYVAGMHWDPGPYWDWSSFMALLGAPVDRGPHGVGPVGGAVTITPDFTANAQTVNVCPSDDPTGATTACADQTEASNFLYVRTAPSATAPLFADPALHPGAAAGSDEISDWGDTVSQGQQFVVAGVSGDWTGIWYSGQEVWFYNPGGINTTPACGVRIIRAAGPSAISVYGEGYPQPSEYPAGLSPSTEAPLTAYSVPPGQGYVSTAAPVSTDDFFSTGDVVVTGAGQLYTIQYDHRLALVNASDVTATDAPAAHRR